MKRKCYIIEAENGVGLYFSRYLAEINMDYLSQWDRLLMEMETYEEAKKYIFLKYGSDDEIHLENFRINRTVYRDKTERRYFFVQSRAVIGYGYDDIMRKAFRCHFHLGSYDIVNVDNAWEAEGYARKGFVEEYGVAEYQYKGELLAGESIAFAEMLWVNGLCETKPTYTKIYGVN